jgi:hypothetical protein
MKRVTAKVVSRQNGLLLVEWLGVDGVTPKRAWVTPDMVVSEEGRLATVDHPDGGIPYGVDWAELISGTISVSEIATKLKQSGLWTVEDLQRDPNVALGIIRAVAGDTLQTLLHNAREHQRALR